jgi:hypothetical protein
MVDRLYAPVSTDEELVMYGREVVPPIGEDVVRERCSRHGPMMRAVLAPKADKYDLLLRAATANQDLKSLFAAVNEPEDAGEASHRLLHLHVEHSDGQPTYRAAHSEFASHWVVREIVQRQANVDRDNLIAVASGRHDLGGQIRGRIYEALIRDKLPSLGEITACELLDDGIRGNTISLTVSDNVTFPATGTYVVDAVAPQRRPEGQAQAQVYINVTIDLTHGIKSNAFNAMLVEHKVADDAEVIYLWVVPSDKAPMFRKQTRVKSGGRRPPFSHTVRQYLFVHDIVE